MADKQRPYSLRFTRLMAFFLALALMLGLIPPAHADTSDANFLGTGSGQSPTATNPAYTWYSNKIGLRVSVVDVDGNVMTKNFNAIDIRWSEPSKSTESYLATKFQGIYDDSLKKTLFMSNTEVDKLVSDLIGKILPELLTYLTSGNRTYKIPMPIVKYSSNVYGSNQDNVRAYFINGATLTSDPVVIPYVPTKDDVDKSVSDAVNNTLSGKGNSSKPGGGGGGGSSSKPSNELTMTEISAQITEIKREGAYTSGGIVGSRMNSFWNYAKSTYLNLYNSVRATKGNDIRNTVGLTPSMESLSNKLFSNLRSYYSANVIPPIEDVKSKKVTPQEYASIQKYSDSLMAKLGGYLKIEYARELPKLPTIDKSDMRISVWRPSKSGLNSASSWSSFLTSSAYGKTYHVSAYIDGNVARIGEPVDWDSFMDEHPSISDGYDDARDTAAYQGWSRDSAISDELIDRAIDITESPISTAIIWGDTSNGMLEENRIIWDEGKAGAVPALVHNILIEELANSVGISLSSDPYTANRQLAVGILNSNKPGDSKYNTYEDMYLSIGPFTGLPQSNVDGFFILQYIADHTDIIGKVTERVYKELGMEFGEGAKPPEQSAWDKDETGLSDKMASGDMIGLIKYFLNMSNSFAADGTPVWVFDFDTPGGAQLDDYYKWLAAAYPGKDTKLVDTPANRFQFFEYQLVVEPIFWFVPKLGKVDYIETDYGKYWYGTPSNWVQWAETKGYHKEITTWKLRSNIANSLRLSDSSYSITEGKTDISGQDHDGVYYKDLDIVIDNEPEEMDQTSSSSGLAKTGSDNPMYNQMHLRDGTGNSPRHINGYAVNIIQVGMPKLKQDDGSTSTWNQTSSTPDTPQKFTVNIDKSDGKSETVDVNYKIIKYYELWQYDETGTLVSKIQPHEIPGSSSDPYPYYDNLEPGKIYVENEKPGNIKWKVVDWFTTEDLPDGQLTQEYVADNFPEYNEFKSNPINNKIYHTDTKPTGKNYYEMGKDSGSDEERVLVVLLVQEDKPEKDTTGPGKTSITESQISKVIATGDDIGGIWGNYRFDSYIDAVDTQHGGWVIHNECEDEDGNVYCCNEPAGTCSDITRVMRGEHHVDATWAGLHPLKAVEVAAKSGSADVFGVITRCGAKAEKEIYLPYEVETDSRVDWFLHANSDEAGDLSGGLEYFTTIWRDPVDKVTLAGYKTKEMEKGYAHISTLVKTSTASTHHAPAQARAENKIWMQDLVVKLGVKSSDIRTTATCAGCGCPSHHTVVSRDYDVKTKMNGQSQTFVELTAPVSTAVYAGVPKQQAKAEVKPMKDFSVDYGAGVSTKSAHFVKLQTNNIDFYPYIRMSYQITADGYKETDNNTVYNRNTLGDPTWWKNEENYKNYLRDRTVYILSDNKSSILPTNSVEVSWFNKTQQNGKYGIQMTSQQWSVHKRATDGTAKWKVPNQVLPGGALYTLSTKDTETYIKTITYSTLVDEKSREFMTIPDTSRYTVQQVVDSNTNYINEAKDVIEHYRLAEWVNKDFNLEHPWDNTSTAVKILTGGEDLSNLGLSLKASTDTKYNFQNGTPKNDALEGDLDILTETYTTSVYKCFTDTDGNIYMAIATSAPGQYQLTVEQLTTILSTIKDAKGTNLSTLSADNVSVELLKIGKKTQKVGTRDNPEAGTILANLKNNQALNKLYVMNLKTGLIENVVNSVERNTGNDLSAPWAMTQDVAGGYIDGKWYNEANDGIYIVAQTATYKVGFGIPTRRVAALDPRLEPATSSKGTIFNNAHLAQFRIDNKSTSAKAEGKPEGYVGTFDGIEVIMPDLENMYYSRPFFIPDASVSDLS